jgi:hypothetical protein
VLRHPRDHREDVEYLVGHDGSDVSDGSTASLGRNGSELLDKRAARAGEAVLGVGVDFDMARK